MNKRFHIDKDYVLSLHESHKTDKMILKEQSGDLKSQLQSMIDNGQVPDVIGISELETTNPIRRFAIKKKSKKNPGTFVYLFIDFKYGSFGPDGKFTFGSGVWVPEKKKPTEQEIVNTGFQEKEIENYKTKYGAKTKKEAIDSGWDLTNLKKVTINGVDLYIPSSRQNVINAVSQEQKDALAAFKLRYNAKEHDELKPGEREMDWIEVSIPDSERLFGPKVRLYRKRSEILKTSDEPYRNLEKSYDLTAKECADKVLRYFDNYRTNRDMGTDYFINEKPKVQFCKNKYHNRWGVRVNAGKLNSILDLMSRDINEFQGVNQPPSVEQPGSNRHMWYLENL